MHQIGVIPMPPAISTVWGASSVSGKWLRGPPTWKVWPTRACSTM